MLSAPRRHECRNQSPAIPVCTSTSDGDTAALRARLLERGASVLSTERQGAHSWTTLADPEGNEFCV
jgi:Glyoxalase-like domain